MNRMGFGIVVPLAVLAVVVPTVLLAVKRRLTNISETTIDEAALAMPAVRLTSGALRKLPSPEWRVVHEIAPDRLDGVQHVLIGPPGIYAVTTSMDPLPSAPQADAAPDATQVAAAAIARGGLDDALRRCAMSSDQMVVVHWGVDPAESPVSVVTLPGVTAVDGRRLSDWTAGLPTVLTPSQVDLAWQTVAVAIGRPDPLA